MKTFLRSLAFVSLVGCGAGYISPAVNPGASSDAVRVVPMTAETILIANQSQYHPKQLPRIFFTSAGAGRGLRATGAIPQPVIQPSQSGRINTRLPPPVSHGPYEIGVGDVLVLGTPPMGNSADQLTGLQAAANARQGYRVQSDGSIAIPKVGRVQVAGMTLEHAESALFQRLVEAQIDPSFSLEVSEFNARKISVGGAVAQPTVVPVAQSQLHLDQALAAAGGLEVEDRDATAIRIYRDGALYQLPVSALYSDQGLAKLPLKDGDSIFVDTQFQLDQAQAYFEQQIQIAELKQSSRLAALSELRTEVDLRRGSLVEQRQNYLARLDLDSVPRDYVYLTGEVKTQSRYPLPFGRPATLADALYGAGGGVPTRTGNVREIYVLRASPDPRDLGAVTAWQLDGRAVTNLTLATRFQLRPNDIIFVAEQPVTRWNRVVSQITPSLITLGAQGVTQ